MSTRALHDPMQARATTTVVVDRTLAKVRLQAAATAALERQGTFVRVAVTVPAVGTLMSAHGAEVKT